MDFAQFILEHEGEDPAALALARGRLASQVEDFDLALTTLEVRRKLRTKVPQWYAVPSLRYPLRLSGEQCSSAETAYYKAWVALRSVPSNRTFLPLFDRFALDGKEKSDILGPFCPISVADLTGGLGVDSWAFAQVASAVLYNEMRPELADAARQNFAALGLANVRVSCAELCPGKLAEVLDGFTPDVIFLDPARRAQDGRKVFRLEDCQPDVLQLLPELLDACPHILLKLSPMADITLVARQLGCVKEVHVVGADGECKELLLNLERGYTVSFRTFIYENGATLALDEVPETVPVLSGDLLFEPGKALLKAGAFDLPCRYGLEKLEQHTHLYRASARVEALTPFGKWFRILETVPLDKRSMKEVSRRYPKASVTARNIPMTSDELRKRMGVADGGPVHVFGVKSMSGNVLIVCTGS